MGCTNGKSADSCKDMSNTINNLINSYSSIEFYIQNQRVQTFESLLKDMDELEKEEIALQENEVNEMENIHKDLNIFKRFKVVNKYKYEIVVSKFLKNMKQCIQKLQSINDINTQYLIKLNEFNNSSKTMKISKKIDDKIQRLHQLIMRVTFYLEIEYNTIGSINCTTHMIELNSTFHKRLSTHKISQQGSDKEIEEVY